MDALGDPTRRAIFERLAAGPAPVGRLAEGLPISRPAVSQHLRVLKEAGLVTDRPIGTRRIYAVEPAGVVAMREYWERFWAQALVAFQDAAARSKQQDRETIDARDN
jgi:DNA-binding transcriptional ArsR family regulator